MNCAVCHYRVTIKEERGTKLEVYFRFSIFSTMLTCSNFTSILFLAPVETLGRPNENTKHLDPDSVWCLILDSKYLFLPHLILRRLKKKKTSHHKVTWDYRCATGSYNHAAMQQSASSQGVPASLSDSYFPLAASRKIETVYEKRKEGGKCHLSSVPPPGVCPCSRARKSRIKTPKLSSELPT